MAKRETSSSKNVPSFKPAKGRSSWLWALIAVVLATLLFVAFFDYAPTQSFHNTTNPTDHNLVGRFGAEVSWWSLYLFGGAAWLVPVCLGLLGVMLVLGLRKFILSRLIAMVLCLITGSGLLAMTDAWFTSTAKYHGGPGGVFGELIYQKALLDILGPFGTGMILGTVYAAGTVMIIVAFFSDMGGEVKSASEWWAAWKAQRAEKAKQREELLKLAREAAEKQKTALPRPAAKPAAAPGSIMPVRSSQAGPPPEAKKLAVAKRDPVPETAPATGDKSATPAKPVEPPAAEKSAKTSTAKGPANLPPPPVKEAPEEPKISLRIVTPEATKKARIDLPKSRGDYVFPTLDMLNEPAKNPDTDEAEQARTAEALLRTLGEFGVEVTLGEIHIGPVITRYEIFPAPGVRVEKIASLDKNIALGLRAQSVRILAPVPGKGCVGVEVPNKIPTPVGIREILESQDWADAKAEIPLALGRDVGGRPVIADLARMPHLLIAGATGSGKTVCINSIITSLLYFASPDDLRFIMVDPKIVEMKAFNDLPHMLIPVVTDPKKVPAALRWLIGEMEMRYQIFGKVGVRNIAGFNGRTKLAKEMPAAPSKEERKDAADELGIEVPRDDEIKIPEKMPYIVCIIDELADLMMVAPADIETGIARLAQLARAAGIHLILATQRPSVNVITGVIKANLPCRIAFQVASKVDSRTILDSGGADQLIGRGDMLFSPPGTAKLVRAQGGYVSDEELHRVVDFLKRNGPPEFAEDVQAQIEAGDVEDGDGEDEEIDEADDELMKQAMEVLRSTRRASTSMLQRRLRIGYNRAARIMELLESRGIVGPENGSSPREILVDLDTL
jgi:S-DNA-T family DNA segregation ATPase FtsK/SpoIIIE